MNVGIRPNLPSIPANVLDKNKGAGDTKRTESGILDADRAVIVEFSGEYQEFSENVRGLKEKIKKYINQPANKKKLKLFKEKIETGLYFVDCRELASDMLNLA
ncbi:hypothetical protein FACS1894198_4720 [Clostridia bacterium]|nr:hypothetical protein FACS1894198_4720 [Clostridia bacterium]